MCGGSYFRDYLGCQKCLLLHGARSERDNAYWGSVLAVASNALCTGTPTASFQKIFESAGASVVGPTTGGTVSSDAKSGETAVSLYYTEKGSQAPGPSRVALRVLRLPARRRPRRRGRDRRLEEQRRRQRVVAAVVVQGRPIRKAATRPPLAPPLRPRVMWRRPRA
ncbi:hypothetical protein PG987_002335 [Apiospora arundinis]